MAMRLQRLALCLLPFLLAGAAFAAGDGGGHGDEHGALEVPVYEIINFILLVGVIIYFARTPAKEFFKSRRSTIESDITAATSLLDDAEQTNSELQRRIADLDNEVEEIRAVARRRAEEERERILAEAHDSAERIRRDAVASVDQEVRKAQADLRDEAAALASELAAGILKEKVGDADRDRLMDDFISRVEQGGAATNGSGA